MKTEILTPSVSQTYSSQTSPSIDLTLNVPHLISTLIDGNIVVDFDRHFNRYIIPNSAMSLNQATA